MSTTINESKIDATDRLRREGRWEEAQQYRDEVRKKLRADGMKRTEAAEAAWDAMLEEYPPLADAPGAGAAVLPESEVPAEWANVGTPDLIGDFLWVYSQLGNPHIQTSDAPGPGAWTLLRWARANTDRFFDQFASRAGTLLARAEEERRREQEERAQADKNDDRLTEILRDVQARLSGELARNTPAKIEAQVRNRVEQWQEDHVVDLPEEPARALELAMVGIVDNTIEMVLECPKPFRKARKENDERLRQQDDGK